MKKKSDPPKIAEAPLYVTITRPGETIPPPPPPCQDSLLCKRQCMRIGEFRAAVTSDCAEGPLRLWHPIFNWRPRPLASTASPRLVTLRARALVWQHLHTPCFDDRKGETLVRIGNSIGLGRVSGEHTARSPTPRWPPGARPA